MLGRHRPRRDVYHTGATLPVSATGTVGVGLGSGTSTGTVGLLAPTLDISRPGQEEPLDGVRVVFQLTPGTEAPAEMNSLFPGSRALCLAENATHNLHNLLTLRGAEVRDARGWSRYLAEAIELFADNTDVAFASHASHAVFTQPKHVEASALLADVLTRLGFGSECATWRNNFLTGAQELHHSPSPSRSTPPPWPAP